MHVFCFLLNFRYQMVNQTLRIVILIAGSLFAALNGNTQRYLSDIDSSFFIKDTVRPIIKRFENLRFTGYIQPQFQVAESKGSPSFSGGNFFCTIQEPFHAQKGEGEAGLPSSFKDPLSPGNVLLPDRCHRKRGNSQGHVFETI